MTNMLKSLLILIKTKFIGHKSVEEKCGRNGLMQFKAKLPQMTCFLSAQSLLPAVQVSFM